MLILLHLLMVNDLFAADADGDSVDSSIDCDDSNASIGGPTTYYMDSDGDSYGDSSDAGFSTCANVSSMSQLVTNNNDYHKGEYDVNTIHYILNCDVL